MDYLFWMYFILIISQIIVIEKYPMYAMDFVIPKPRVSQKELRSNEVIIAQIYIELSAPIFN